MGLGRSARPGLRRLIAGDAVRSAGRLDIRVIEVDGTRAATAIAGTVADHFRPYLPPQEPAPGGGSRQHSQS